MTLVETLTSVELGLIYGIVAVGIYVAFKVLDYPDLTCDGSFTAGAATCASCLQSGLPISSAIVLACTVGGLSGFVTGILNRFCKISPLLSGILTAFMLYSVNLRIMKGIPNITLSLDASFLTSMPILILFSGGICILLSYILLTDFGLGIRCLGKNSKLAIIQGINPDFYTIIGLILSNALISLGGSLFSLHQGFADVSVGVGTIIMGIASIMVGEKILPDRPIYWDILSCIVGSIVYRIIVALSLHLEWLGLTSSDLNLVTGVLVILIMLMPKKQNFKEAISC